MGAPVTLCDRAGGGAEVVVDTGAAAVVLVVGAEAVAGRGIVVVGMEVRSSS